MQNNSVITQCFFPPLCACLSVCCREIGTALQHSYFGPGSGLFHYARLGCRGDEKSLLECRSRKFVTSDCNHGSEAGVVCEPPEGQCIFSESEAIMTFKVTADVNTHAFRCPRQTFKLQWNRIEYKSSSGLLSKSGFESSFNASMSALMTNTAIWQTTLLLL